LEVGGCGHEKYLPNLAGHCFIDHTLSYGFGSIPDVQFSAADPTRQPTWWNYLRAFGARWFVAMSGPLTVPFAVLAVYAPATYQKIILATLAVVCAGFSSYWVWRAERQARNAAEDRATEAETTLRKKDDKTWKVTKLSEFVEEGDKLRHDILTPGADGAVWQIALEAWLNGVNDLLAEHCAPQASVRFKDLSNMLRGIYFGVPHDYQDHYSALERRIQNLHQILEKPDVFI
jgi:hypothetical protein